MNEKTMNVHQALAELKLLDKRIQDATHNPVWVIPNEHGNTVINGVKLANVIDEMRANYQKVTDLIAYRDALKRAVVQSNAVTKVTIAGVEYTVAEAIDAKNHGMATLSALRNRMLHDYEQARSTAEIQNGSRLEGRASEFIRSMTGQTVTKDMTEEMRRMRDDFITAHTTELIDPIGVRKVAADLDEKITAFTAEVDAVLSTSNSLTEITVRW
jgi:transcriptional antiterminator Rof (Rho-off)